MCCEGPFGAISRDRRSTRQSAFWSIPSPFFFGLQHLQVLKLWAIWQCIPKPFIDSSTALFHRRLDFLLQGLAHINISCLVPFGQVSMLCSSIQIPEIQGFTSVIGTKYAFEDTKYIKMNPNHGLITHAAAPLATLDPPIIDRI
uniref:Uncharacterized protein n=1 Tax=Solanum tuberosum TaxID=4113 RepID=M1DYK7_SOLTU